MCHGPPPPQLIYLFQKKLSILPQSNLQQYNHGRLLFRKRKVWDTEELGFKFKSYCTVLYCTVLYCTVLYCTVLYCTVLCCTVLYCTLLHCTVLYCIKLQCTVLIGLPFIVLFYRFKNFLCQFKFLHSTALYFTELLLYCTEIKCTALQFTTVY